MTHANNNEAALHRFISKYMELTDDEWQAVLDMDIFRSVAKGTVLLEEGQRSDEGYFVLQGCLRAYYIIDGDEKTTDFYTEMEGHTPACVLTKEPSAYSIAAVEDSIITVGNPDMEEEMYARFPRFETICRKVSEELITQQQVSFSDFKTSSPEERYIRLTESRPDLLQRVPQHQLASYLGITPQSLSRIRARIVKK